MKPGNTKLARLAEVDYFFAGIGTGETLSGAGKYLKEKKDVKGEEAINIAKFIRNTGNFDVGYSSGTALLGAVNYLKDNGLRVRMLL